MKITCKIEQKSFDIILYIHNIVETYLSKTMKTLADLETQAETVSKILKAISHPKRLIILCRLAE